MLLYKVVQVLQPTMFPTNTGIYKALRLPAEHWKQLNGLAPEAPCLQASIMLQLVL